MKKVASCKKFFWNCFAYFKKKSLPILQHAKTFIIFFAYLLNKSKKISQIKKIFSKFFRNLKKTERGFSCTVDD